MVQSTTTTTLRSSSPPSDSGPTRASSARTTPSLADRAWPTVGLAAGLLGGAATFLGDVHVAVPDSQTSTAAVVADVNRGAAHLSVVAGYLAVAFLLLLAAVWQRQMLATHAGSTAARLVPLGLTASAAALTLGYGWKGAMAIYLPGGLDENTFDQQGLYIYYMLNDFGGFIGWLGVVVAAAGMAWLGLRERAVPRWIGALSAIPPLATLAIVSWVGLPGTPGLFAALWLIVAFGGLTAHTLTRRP